MDTRVPLCGEGSLLIFLSGFGYSKRNFEESCEELIEAFEASRNKEKAAPIEKEIAQDIDDVLRLIVGRLQKGICKDGVTCAVICFEEGVEHIQNSLGNLPKKVADVFKKNVAIFAIHSGSYYRGITEDLAKIAINIDLADDGSEESLVETGDRDGKLTKKVHFPSKKNPYILKNCIAHLGVKNFILNCLNLSGDTTGYCKTHGADDIKRGETASPSEVGASTSSSHMEQDTTSVQRVAEQKDFTAQKVVGPIGGEIIIAGCGVRFRTGSVKKEIEFQIAVEHRVHPSTEDEVQITPFLRCLPPIRFDCPVKVKLQARCHARSSNVKAFVMIEQESGDSPVPLREISLSSGDGVIEFDCYHFTGFWAYVKRLVFGETEFVIQPTLYLSRNEGNFCLTLRTENTREPPENPLNPEFIMASVMFDRFYLRGGEEIPISLRCESPENLEILPHGDLVFVADENFCKVGSQHIRFTMELKPPALEMLTLLCKIGEQEIRFRQQFPDEPQKYSEFNIGCVNNLTT